ncbi:patatin-like phospholipase family protein [Chloroflexota bacterium]
MSREEDKAFFEVFDDEMENWIVPRSKMEPPPEKDVDKKYYPKVDHKLLGLALSGGGIRSATYALGVLQRMAKAGILKFVDVLSTASGGGYLGSSWSSLTANSESGLGQERRVIESEFGSEEDTFPFQFVDQEGREEHQLFDRESDAVRHLRAHGYWLAPHLGFFDVWTWVAVFRYLFSTVINILLVPTPWILLIMMLTLVIPGTFWNRQDPMAVPALLHSLWLGPTLILLVLFLPFVWMHRKPSDEGAEIKHGYYLVQKIGLTLAIIWMLVDLFILGIWGFYEFLHIAVPWIVTAGGPGAALIIAVKAIYNNFTKDVNGGVTSDITEGIFKKVLGFVIGIIGYIALVLILVAGYVALDWYFYPERLTSGLLPGNATLYFSIIVGALLVAVAMFRMPVRGFLNKLSLQNLYTRGMYKAYILKADPTGEKVVPRERGFCLANLRVKDEDPVPDMPYHLIGTALNTSGDKDLKRLGRRSDSFVLANRISGSRLTGYDKTSAGYADMPLSEAMAISGAALSPNMGRITTTSFSILLTLLNVRIGSWVRNPTPEDSDGNKRPWRPLIWYWGKELFGIASADDRYIYLSDGGHFDNSAVYELLKRRCKYILAVDAGTDFDNLATVSRLARVDLGVQMDVNLDYFKPDPETGLSQQPYIVVRLKYPPVPGDTNPAEGVMIWISTTMTKRQKPDVFKYKETDSSFPFSSTGDQFFDQIQFEAYRQLGHSAAGTLIDDADLKKSNLTRNQLEVALDELLKTAASWQ